jgi:hypothetical protein
VTALVQVGGMLFPRSYTADQFSPAEEARQDFEVAQYERWMDENGWLEELPEAHERERA